MRDKQLRSRLNGLSEALVLISLLLASPVHAGDNPLPFLNAIATNPIEGGRGDRYAVHLYHRDPGILASYLDVERSYTVVRNTNYVAVTSSHYSYPRKTDKIDTKPTFVADYDLADFQRIRAAVVRIYGAAPGDADLVEFVNRYIEKKNYSRGFDIASQVVRSKEGDCSEHAVLLASIMRMFGIPAKVVFGIKFIKVGDSDRAFTHAWIEYIRQGAWKAADPTLMTTVDRSYIPVGTLENEGMDFTVDLVPILQKMPTRIELSGL